MDPRSDLELWRLARADPDAFGVLFERHGRAVYAFCARRTADLALAEDLTSIVFLEAWRRRKRTEITGESLLPWLLGIAHNAVRNAHRSRRRHRAALARLPPEPLEAAADDVASRIDAEWALALSIHGSPPPDAYEIWLNALVPQAQIEVWNGSGHMLHLDDPVRFAERIRRLVADTAGR